jgi:hypothetical protein
VGTDIMPLMKKKNPPQLRSLYKPVYLWLMSLLALLIVAGRFDNDFIGIVITTTILATSIYIPFVVAQHGFKLRKSKQFLQGFLTFIILVGINFAVILCIHEFAPFFTGILGTSVY